MLSFKKMNNLSVIILTKNNEKEISDLIKSVKFADEIIIIDDYSIDKTTEISESLNARILKNKLKSFSEQRNLGLKIAKNDWVLFLDSDEVISDELVVEIKKCLAENFYDGYLIKRADYFLGKRMHYGDVRDVWILRLGKKDKGRWMGDVHETWEIKGRLSKMKNEIKHYSHEDIAGFLKKINFYSSIRAEELKDKKVKAALGSILFYPPGKFLYLFVIKLGFLDGLYGFVHAVLMSFYSFLVRSKLYFLSKK